jgi:RNA recognition motif-containing protein
MCLFFLLEKLRRYFKNFGPVQDAVVMKDPVSKRSRGFGFITFYDVNSVDNVLANEPHTIDARKVTCPSFVRVLSSSFHAFSLSFFLS